MKQMFLGLLCLGMVGCSQMSTYEQAALLSEAVADAEYVFEPFPWGLQGDPELQEHVIELPAGKTFYRAYELPERRGRFSVQLRTYIVKTPKGDGFFYPVVELLDSNKRLIEKMKPQLRFTQLSPEGRYAAVPIEINPDVSFMVIRTEPKLYGQEASYTTKHQGASWSYSVSPFSKREPASYMVLGQLELLTPDEGYGRPFEKLSGPYWQVTWGRGQKKLLSGSDFLPNMTLGGGLNATLGYSFAIPGRPSSSVRTGLGLTYYTLNDANSQSNTQYGFTGDLLWVESNQVSSIGIGLTGVSGLTLEVPGQDLEYKPAFGPKVLLEVRGAMGVSLGAYFSWLTYEDQFGETTGSNQFGLYLHRLY